MNLTVKQAEKLINVAKESISYFFDDKEYVVPKNIKEEFSMEKGVFVSLYILNSKEKKDELIGCIGFHEPIMPLAESVASAARSAAFEDPRFPPLKKEQMKKLRIEISVLTEPKVIEVSKPSEYPKKIVIGKDGVMVKDNFGAGLLLPQIAVEWGWDAKEFLSNTCRKAGLEPNCWNNMKRNVYKFRVQTFTEDKNKKEKVIEKNFS